MPRMGLPAGTIDEDVRDSGSRDHWGRNLPNPEGKRRPWIQHAGRTLGLVSARLCADSDGAIESVAPTGR